MVYCIEMAKQITKENLSNANTNRTHLKIKSVDMKVFLTVKQHEMFEAIWLSVSGRADALKTILNRYVFNVWELRRPIKFDLGDILLSGVTEPCFERIWIELECTGKVWLML